MEQAQAGSWDPGRSLGDTWLAGVPGDKGAHRITFCLVSTKEAVSSGTIIWGGALTPAYWVRKALWRDL